MIITAAVASYNHKPYIRQCLESIVSQEHDGIDLCWVDDSSSDGTFELLKELIQSEVPRGRFRNVIVRQNSHNRGAAFSLNLAARLSDAPFISFMNSDDFYSRKRLAMLIEAVPKDEPVFAFSWVMPVDNDGRSMVTDRTGELIAFQDDILFHRFGSYSAAMLHRQIASSTGNFFVSRQLFNDIGGFVDLKYCHDWMFALQACLKCEPTVVRERLYFYRLHPTNSFKSLSGVAENETDRVISAYYTKLALEPPTNSLVPCPRRHPIEFWARATVTETSYYASRVFFPYTLKTRLLR